MSNGKQRTGHRYAGVAMQRPFDLLDFTLTWREMMRFSLPVASSRPVLSVGPHRLENRIRPVLVASADRQVSALPNRSPLPSVDRPEEPVADQTVTMLSILERQVVQIALNDHWLTVPSDRRAIRLLQRLQGTETKGLANNRLEALRRYLILYRHGRVNEAIETTAVSAGVTPATLRAAERLTDLAAMTG